MIYVDKRPLEKRQKHALKADGVAVTHKGGCHCGAVRFEVEAAANIIGWDCNCSLCAMRRNVHVVVPVTNMLIVVL